MELINIVEKALTMAIDEIVRDIIVQKAGYGVDSEIKDIIKDKAKEIIKEPEIEALIRERILHWIKKQ